MCGSMVDIQCAMAEIRRGKKEDMHRAATAYARSVCGSQVSYYVK